MGGETILVITPIGMPPYAIRGLTETLEPIEESANIRRTVNGGAVNLSPPQFRKYRVTINCDDMDPPALDGVWPGSLLTIDCVSELGFLTGVSGADPQREIVPGSERVSGDYTFYRLRLNVMVAEPWEQVTDEYGAAVGWRLPCIEV